MSIGNYTRFTTNPAENDPLNVRIRSFMNDNVDGNGQRILDEDNPENWSAEKVRAAAEMFQREDQAHQNRVANGQTADAFLAAHPEFLDTTANAQLMNHELNRTFGEGVYTLAHYEQAYESLRSSNFLNLDQKIVREQEKEAAKARAEQERARREARAFSEDVAESLSMDELRRRADEQLREQMQRRAEEGGW